MARIKQVVRDDGQLVPFKERKITEAIARALSAAGTPDRALAFELSGVVVMFLGRQFEETPPTTIEVREMLVRALKETGHAAAARKLEEELDNRKSLESSLSVVSEGELGLTDGVSSPWNRDRLVDHLQRSLGVPESVAEEVASGVEGRLRESRYERVNGALVTELIRHELEHRGLASGVAPTPGYRLDADRVAAILRGAESTSVDREIAGEVLRRHAATTLFSSAVIDGHQVGLLHVHGLSDPLRLERAEIPAPLLLSPDGDEAETLLRLRRLLDGIREHVREEVRLSGLVDVLSETPAATEDPEGFARRVLLALDFRDAYGGWRCPRPHVDVTLRAEEKGRGFRSAILRLLTAHALGPNVAVSVMIGSTAEALDAETEEILEGLGRACPRAALQILRDETPAGVPAPWPLIVSLGRITLNLPLLVATRGARSVDDVIESVTDLGGRVLRGFQESFWLQREGRPIGLHGLVVGLGGPGHVQANADGQRVDAEVWGLRAAMDLLVARGVVKKGRVPAVAARLLDALHYALSAPWDGIHFAVRLGVSREPSIRRRLFDVCHHEATRNGNDTLDEVLRVRQVEPLALPVGLPVLSEANAPLLDSPFAESLDAGLSPALPVFRDGHASLVETLEAIREKTCLSVISLGRSGSVDTVLEVQEELFISS